MLLWVAMTTTPRVWDDDYEPTPEELAETISIDATPEELAHAVLTFKPPVN